MGDKTQNKVTPVKLFCVNSIPCNWDETLSPIIFITGFFTTNRTYTGVKFKIGKQTRRKVYSVDLRNHGKSEYSEEFTLEHLVADLENFMAEENIAKAILAGHSMGGKIAMALSLKHPDKVEKVIVEDSPLVSTKAYDEAVEYNFSRIKRVHQTVHRLPKEMSLTDVHQKLSPFITELFPTVVKNFTAAKCDLLLPLQKESDGSFKWEFDMDCVLDILNHLHDFEIDLSTNPVNTCDALLLSGSKSFYRLHDSLEIFYKHFPNLECRIIENGFHTYHVEFPEQYVEIVSKFINKKDA